MNEYKWHGEIRSVLECVENARDLGGYPLENGSLTKHGRVIRCEVPVSPTESDIRYLRENGFADVIDFRDAAVAEKQPHGLAQLDGFVYHACPVNAGSRVAPTAEDVPPMYLSITKEENFHRAWRILAASECGVVYNCFAGRDRTGTFSMILLTHAGVIREAVIEDYVITKEYNRERFARIRVERPHIDLNVVTPRTWYAEDFLRLFEETYGSTDGYFRSIGLNDNEIQKIRMKLR